MRIDLVITELDTGGAERCCAELAVFLTSRDHQVRILVLGPKPVPPNCAISDWLEKERIRVVYLGGASWRSFPAVAWRLRNAFFADKPDVVQSFLWHANVLVAAVLPYRSVPFLGGVRVAEPRAWRHFFSRWASKRMQTVVCVSESIREWCVKVEGVSPEKLVVIGNGVRVPTMPLPTIDSASHQVPDNAKVLLLVGRLAEQKGIDVLLQYAPRLIQQLPDYHLVLIGDGPLRNACESMASTPELGGRMHILGRRNDVASWMTRAQLFVFPTRYEGMPNVLLEAMAAKRAIATMQVEGVQELLGPTLAEQSVPSGNWAEFFELVVQLAQDESKREQLGKSNYERVTDEFQLEKQLAKYEDLYRTLVRGA